MKRVFWLLGLAVILTGCSAESREIDRAMELRNKLLDSVSCEFQAEITADYGDTLNMFAVDCQADAGGNLCFTVTAPETIAGITGTVSDAGGTLTFDETALYFALMADDQLTPVSAPWIFLKTLRSGYITSACMEEELLHLTVDDSYEEDALQLDIWVDAEDRPVRSEILYDGKRILSLDVENFGIS